MVNRTVGRGALLIAGSSLLAACAGGPSAQTAGSGAPRGARVVADVAGFTGPEAVRYDPDQDVYFVSNFGPGEPREADNNGYISRMRPDGTVEHLRFMSSGNGVMLHSPRGMFIVADTLWVADADGVKGFNRRTGAPVAGVDVATGRQIGFLNDVAASPDGTVYVTDTGTNTIYRVAGRTVSVAIQDTALTRPNGITWDARNDRFLVGAGGGAPIFAWRPGTPGVQVVGTSAGSRWDGVEVLPDGRILASSLADSTLYVFPAQGGTGQVVTKTTGLPADIAVDTRRFRVAVPNIARNMVEIWELPR